jgi:hypothetical protein
LLDLIERISKVGASFRSLGDPLWDTSSSQGRLLSTLFGRDRWSLSAILSHCAAGEYKFLGDVTLEQLLENRDRLPVIQGLPDRAYRTEPSPLVLPDDVSDAAHSVDLRHVQEGNRDAEIWRPIARLCRRIYLEGGDKDAAMTEAVGLNAQFPRPQPESWVAAKVNNWWVLTLEEKNEFGPGYRARRWMQSLANDPPLLALLCWLKEQNGPHSRGFMIADGMIGTHLTGWWSEPKLRLYRRRLRQDGWVVQIQKPMKGRSALYQWGPTALRELFPSDSWGAEFNALSSTQHTHAPRPPC